MVTSDMYQLIQGLKEVYAAYLNGQGSVMSVGQWNKVVSWLFCMLWEVSWLQGLLWYWCLVHSFCSTYGSQKYFFFGIPLCPQPQEWAMLKKCSRFATSKSLYSLNFQQSFSVHRFIFAGSSMSSIAEMKMYILSSFFPPSCLLSEDGIPMTNQEKFGWKTS